MVGRLRVIDEERDLREALSHHSEPGERWAMIADSYSYAVSTHGRVFSFQYGDFLRPAPNTSGHLQVVIKVHGRRKMLTVHRLVALAFIENPRPRRYRLVRHLDDIKTNNHSDNLAWGDDHLNALDYARNLASWGTAKNSSSA